MAEKEDESSSSAEPLPITTALSMRPPSPKPHNNNNMPMTTINNSSPRAAVRKYSDDFPMDIPPVHPFLPHSSYDSDGSNGSFVQKRRRGSLDSAGSSGSVKNNSAPPPRQQQQPQQQQPQNPKLLPYHERRKLLQQQQQLKEKQQQQQIQFSPIDPRFLPPEFAVPPNHLFYQQQQQHHLYPGNSEPLPQHQQQQKQPPFPGHPPPLDHTQMAAYINMYGTPPPGYYLVPPGYPTPNSYPSTPNGLSRPVSQPTPLGNYGGYPSGFASPSSSSSSSRPTEPQSSHPPSVGFPPFGTLAARPSPYRGGGAGAGSQPPTNNASKPPKATTSGSQSARSHHHQQQQIRPPSIALSSSLEDSVGSLSRTPPPPPPLPSSTSHPFQGQIPNHQRQQQPQQHRQHRRNGDGSGGSGSGGSGNGAFLGFFNQSWTPPVPFQPGFNTTQNWNNNNSSLPTHPLARRRDSQERPPASLGTHKRLPSINDDDWSDPDKTLDQRLSDDDDEDTDFVHQRRMQQIYGREEDERISLLPPPGISTDEQDGVRRQHHHRYQQQQQQHAVLLAPHRRTGSDHRRTPSSSDALFLVDAVDAINEYNSLRATSGFDQYRTAAAAQPIIGRNTKKKSSKRKKHKRRLQHDPDDSSEDSATEHHYRNLTQKRDRLLEKERAKLIAQWKAEAREEAELSYRERRQDNRSNPNIDALWHALWKRLYRFVAGVAVFVANLPLMIGAVALSVVTLGVVWFKFAEENLDSCEPVHFHSSQCTFPEFPGCFYCNTNSKMYQAALAFHFGCTAIAGLLAMLFVLKVLLAPQVVLDEMSSPTTASPAGLLCMTTVCVFAGHGTVGQIMVTAAACIHMCLVFWFAYISLAYRILPDPSWFPNTVGIGLTAVKMWLYNPVWGYWLMAVSLVCNFFLFPISLIRVAINDKISATVGWMQMSAPATSLYALTIMAQPSFEEEHPDITKFQSLHRMIYLPCMHAMAALALLGFIASCHCLWNRWNEFRTKDFSPAHAAFSFPVLAYANALQAYRGAIISFSQIHSRNWRMIILYIFWFTVLIGGTIVTLYITVRFVYCLRQWTSLDVTGEDEPPAPHETVLALRDMVTAGETMRQPFVSPAILQANETGALVLTTSGGLDGQLRYVRTRRLTALGFEPMMDWIKMEEERTVLLDWAAKHPPRRRSRTLSVPGLDFQYGVGAEFGTGNKGVYYGSINWSGPTTVVPPSHYY